MFPTIPLISIALKAVTALFTLKIFCLVGEDFHYMNWAAIVREIE
jgi:hypothetical protein